MRWLERRFGVADKQLSATAAAGAFQKEWFADLRRRVFDERQPYALLQADVPFELFDLLDIPAVSNQWWAAIVAAKRQAPAYLDAMAADGHHEGLCHYCSLGYASTNRARDGRWRELEVKVNRLGVRSSRDLRVQSRKGYFAPFEKH